jgi:5'-nucleotidase
LKILASAVDAKNPTTPGAASGVWRAGPIAREALHQSVAIDERLVAMTLSGHELTRLLRVLNSGARGTASISGLRVEAGDLETRGKGTDLNRDGKIEYWEINRIRKILTPEGKKFNPNKSYRVVMPEYLAKGGDDLEWVIANLHPAKIEPLPLTLRAAIEDHLKSDTLK